MKYGVKHGLQGHMSLSYTLVRWEGDSAIERAEADSVAFFSDEDVARACAAVLNAEWGVLAALLESRAPQARPNIDANNICDPNLIRPLLDFVRAQKLALSKACEGAKTYGDSRMVDVCSVCHEPLYEHVKPGVDAGGRELAPVQHAPVPDNMRWVVVDLQGNNESLNLALCPPTKSGEEFIAIPIIETRRDTGMRCTRGKTRLTPNYCPFCGKKYVKPKPKKKASRR